MNHKAPQFETKILYPTDWKGRPKFEEDPANPGHFTRVTKEVQVPILPETDLAERRPLVQKRERSLGRTAVNADKPIYVHSHYRNPKGGDVRSYAPQTRRSYQPRAEYRYARHNRRGAESLWARIPLKAKVYALGTAAVFLTGWFAKDPVTASFNRAVHNTEVAVEQNIVKPVQAFAHDTAVAYDQNVVQPVEHFKEGTVKNVNAATEWVTTLGGLTKEKELLSPIPNDELVKMRGEAVSPTPQPDPDMESAWSRLSSIRPELTSKLTKGQFEDLYKKFGPDMLSDIATAAETKASGEKENTTRTSIVYKYLINELGLTKIQAAGVVGNMVRESGIDPTKKEYTSDPNNPNFIQAGKGAGINQWTSTGRQEALKAYAKKLGLPETDLSLQLAFTKEEFTGKYRAVYEDLKKADTIEKATLIAHDGYYRSADDTVKKEQRIEFAKNVLNSDGVSAQPTKKL